MPKPIVIFCHCCLSGNGIEFNHAASIFQELTQDVKNSGLEAAADHYFVGSSGGEANLIACSTLASEKAEIFENPEDSIGELPTLHQLHLFSQVHPNYYFCYFHLKGALHNAATKVTWAAWRHCMSDVIIWNWRNCVKDLDQGYDCAGPHWLTSKAYPMVQDAAYFGGNFWWAKGSHLAQLPELDLHSGRYEAEVWIGKRSRKFYVSAYQHHFPGIACGRNNHTR